MTDIAEGQGIEWDSLSGEHVAEEMRQSSANPAYNLRIGPVTLRAEADLSTSFNDNIGITQHGRTADLIVTPLAILDGHWQASELNTVDLTLGVGYEMYVLNSQYNSLVLSPDSLAQFNFFVGDILFNVHDSFSYQQDPTAIGQLSNTTRLSRFTNDAGVGGTWDLGKFVVELDYDHSNLWVLQSAYSYLTNQSDTFAPKLTVKVSKTINAGIEASFSDVRYQDSFQNNYISYSAGPFAKMKISDFLSFEGGAGAYFSDFATGGGNGDTQNIGSYYAHGGVNHKINDADTEALTAGREYIPGLTSNFTERVYVNYTNTWQATKTISLGANLWWENLDDSESTIRETSNRYSVGLNVNDSLSKEITLGFAYQYILKNADPSDLSYFQNQATVNFRYQF